MFTSCGVFLDACVLVPNWLRDILLTAAQFELYRPLWSHTVLEEMERALVRQIGLLPERAEYTRQQMEGAFPEALIGGFESIISGMPINEKDRHVLAAALLGNAQLIVTNNLKDFPDTALSSLNMKAVHADTFLNDLLARYQNEMYEVLKFMADNTGKAGHPELSLLDIVQSLGATVPHFAAAALLVFSIT